MTRYDDALASLQRTWETCQRDGRALPAVPSFRLDTWTVSLAGWQDDELRAFVDPVAGCVIVVRGNDIELVAGADDPRAELPLGLLIREVLIGWYLRRNRSLDLHAAAVARAGRALVIAGAKSAGKSTLLCHLLQAQGTDYMANDRVLVTMGPPIDERNTLAAVAVPTAVSLREGTVAAFPQLQSGGDTYPEMPDVARVIWSALADQPEAPRPSIPALQLYPGSLAGRMGAGMASEAKVAALLFPAVDPGVDGFEVEPLDVATTAMLLAGAQYGAARAEDGAPARIGDATYFSNLPARSEPLDTASPDTASPDTASLDTAPMVDHPDRNDRQSDPGQLDLEDVARLLPAYRIRCGAAMLRLPPDLLWTEVEQS